MMEEKIRVLYVDDESTLLELCKIYLERSGNFIVTTVTSAPEAIRILELAKFDGIISDYQMPEMDGIEFLKVIRGRGDKTPFIIFTGKGREEVVIEALNSGADHYIQKGGEPKAQFAELAHKIRRAVEHQSDEKLLQKSQNQLANAMDLAHIVNWEFDVASGIFTFNDRFYTLYGTTAEREGGYQMPAEVYAREFVHPEEADLVGKAVQNAITATDPNYTRQIEHRIIRRDGEVRHIIVRFRITKDARGRTVKTHGANQDITDRIVAEESIRSSRAFLDRVIDMSPFAMWISDNVGTVVRVNRALCETINVASDLIIGRYNVLKDVNLEKQGVMPDVKAVFEQHKQARFTIPWKAADAGDTGLLAARDMYIDVAIFPILDTHGNLTNVICQWVDITDRKQAEEAVQAIQEKYAKAFLSVPDAITISELDSGRFIEVNDATTRIFGYSHDELIGKNAVELGIWRDKESRDRLIGQVREHGRVSQFEVLNWRKSGDSFIALVNADTISIGNVPYLVAVIRDITDRKYVEAALIKSEVKSRSILEHLPELVLVHRNGIIQYTNPVAVKTLGYQPDDVVNRQVTDFISPEFHERVAEAVRRRMSGKEVEPYEIEVVGKDGSHRNMVVSGSTIEFDGAPASLIILTDITERKKMEEKLKRSEERYRFIVEDQTEFICRFTPEGRLTFVNDAYCRYFGLDRSRCLGSPHTVKLTPEDARMMKQHLASLTPQNPVAAIEHRIFTPSGEVRWQRWNDRAIFDQNSNVVEYQSVGRDITEHKRAEEALQESKERFRNISDLIPDFAYSCKKARDGEFAIDWITGTPEQITGYTPDEIKKMTCWKFLVIDEDIPVFEKNVTGLSPGESVRCELRIRRKDGGITWLASYTKCVTDQKEPGSLRLYGACRDIAGRKQAEEAVQAIQEKYTKAFLLAPDAITVSEMDTGRFIEVNDAATRLFGYSRDELLGKSAVELGILLSVGDRKRLTDQIRNYGRVSRFELIERRKSGELYNALVNADTVTIGKTTYLITTIRDITERKQAEEALRESEERYSSIFDNNYSVSLIIDPDTGSIVEANTAAARFYGYTHDALISMGIYDLNRLPKETVIRNLQWAKAEKAKHFFTTHYLATGEKRNVEIYSGPIILRGKPLFYSIIHDNTERTKAEEALKQKEAELHDILEGSPIPNFVIDRDHRVISWNKALEEATGFAAADMLGTTRHWQAFYAMERPCLADLLVDGKTEIIREWYSEKIDAVRLAGGIFDGTDFFPHLGTDGKWLHFSASLIRDDHGTIIGAVETLQDITRQKRADEEIRTLQQFQQSIIDNANVWISVLDPKGTILVWNTTAEEITGYPARDVIGKNTIWKELYPDPVYRKQVADNILDIIRMNTYVENFETRIRTKNGDEKIIWWNTQPLRDASGKPVQFITIGRDNTERRRSEERINALRQFEESIIKNANIWISVLDGKGNVSVWNRAAEDISGYTADEVVGKNIIWSRIYPDKEYRRSVTATINEVIGSKKYLENFETRIRTKDGQERIIWWNTRTLQDVPGIDETFIAIGKDVTEQKTLSDAVTLANRKLNLLSSITRHDILNQLMALKGFLELSGDVLNDPVKLANYIATEQKIANTIQDQIQFTKDYEEMGIKAPEWQNVHGSVEKAKKNLPLRGIAVETDSLSLEVYADPLFMRVFYNLIDNAIRYGGEQLKTIRVSSQESDRGLVIVCEDDGVGITEEDKKKLFRKGFGKHTGLGLFLSREILAITGITITENNVPGKGARFEITVPKGAWRFAGMESQSEKH